METEEKVYDLKFMILDMIHVENGKFIKALFNARINGLTIRGFKIAEGEGKPAHILPPQIDINNDKDVSDGSERKKPLIACSMTHEWREEIQTAAIRRWQEELAQRS